MAFRAKMIESELRKNSNIILALDLVTERVEDLLPRSMKILEEAEAHICALKINHHLVLPLGLFNGLRKIIDKAHDSELPVIMDCKANDIGNTNRVIAENYFQAGFDALIANPFVGWAEGLEPVFEVANSMKRGVILLVYMSHKASPEGYGQLIKDPATGENKPQYIYFAERALSWKADGAIVGATFPVKIRDAHEILGEKVPIYSPGVGTQGGDIESAISAGAHYLIIGRTITNAADPSEVAEKMRKTARDSIKEQRGSQPQLSVRKSS